MSKGEILACAKDLVECVQQSSSVKMFLVDETSIEEVEESLPSSLKPIPSTMKLHQVRFTPDRRLWRTICY